MEQSCHSFNKSPHCSNQFGTVFSGVFFFLLVKTFHAHIVCNVKNEQIVNDKDTFTPDDELGDAEIDINPLIQGVKMGKDVDSLISSEPLALKTVKPNDSNCLEQESDIVWDDGRVRQEMHLKLRNIESGVVVVELEWMDVPGCKGLFEEEQYGE